MRRDLGVDEWKPLLLQCFHCLHDRDCYVGESDENVDFLLAQALCQVARCQSDPQTSTTTEIASGCWRRKVVLFLPHLQSLQRLMSRRLQLFSFSLDDTVELTGCTSHRRPAVSLPKKTRKKKIESKKCQSIVSDVSYIVKEEMQFLWVVSH